MMGGAVGLIFLFQHIKNSPKNLPSCKFGVEEIKRAKREYPNGGRDLIYEGLIRNNSSRRESLQAMVGKIYDEKDVFLAEGYTSMRTWIEPHKAIPFKIEIYISDYIIEKYLGGNLGWEKDGFFKSDVYPWFTTCK